MQPEEAEPQPLAHAITYMDAAAQQAMSAAQQKAVGEMIDAASDKIAQKVVAGLEERVTSLEAALENYEQQNRLFFAARDISLLENQAEQDAALMNKMAAFMKDTVKAEIQATKNNIVMQMTDMQGAIHVEQIRDKEMDVSSDDGLYSDDEEEEDKSVAVTQLWHSVGSMPGKGHRRVREAATAPAGGGEGR